METRRIAYRPPRLSAGPANLNRIPRSPKRTPNPRRWPRQLSKPSKPSSLPTIRSGLYLREIGKVDLLRKEDEQRLARQLEASIRIEKLEKELESPDGRPAGAWEIAQYLLDHTSESGPIVDALSAMPGPKAIILSRK